MVKKFLASFLIFFLVLDSQLFSRELTFLPSYIIGDAPLSLLKKDKPDTGVSELLAFYTNQNFEVGLSSFSSVRNIITSMNEDLSRKPSRDLISRICSDLETDYVVQNEVDFSGASDLGSTLIHTMTYDCGGRLIYSQESILKQDFYSDMEKHALKAFSYLNPKRPEKFLGNPNQKQEVIFGIDLSGSLSSDSRELISFIEGTLGSDLSIGLALFGQKGMKVVQPSLNHENIRDVLKRVRFSGSIDSDVLASYLSKLKSNLVFSGYKNRKFILFSDATTGGKSSYKLVSATQDLTSMGLKVYILTGSYFDYNDMNIYRKAARSSGQNLHQIIHEQSLGTQKGLKKIFLFDRKVYVDHSGKQTLRDIDINELQLIPEGEIYRYVDFPHPNNLFEIFQKSTGEKVIQKSPVTSNIREVAEKLVFNAQKSILKTSRKILLKQGKHTNWIYLKEIDDSYLNQDISVQLTFRKSFTEASGFINIPEETKIISGDIPRYLLLEPTEIVKSLNNTSKDKIVSFLKGKVLEIK